MKQSSLKKGMLALTLGLIALVPACRRRCYDCPPKCEKPCYEEEVCYDDNTHYTGGNAVVEEHGYSHKEYIEPVEEDDASVYNSRAKKVRKVNKRYNNNKSYNNKKYAAEEVVEEQVVGNNDADFVDVEEIDVQYPQQAAQPAGKPVLPEAPDTLDKVLQFEE